MRFYEYRLSHVIYGRNKPDLCYIKAKNQYTLYDDTMHPRIEIARVFFGDNGWTYTGLMTASILDTFSHPREAMYRAFSLYSQEAMKKPKK